MSRGAPWRERLLIVGMLVLALAVRAAQRHRGLIYPDGYDYLMMARGIGLHLSPTIALPGGAMFVPPVDAALKPLFPALIALVTPLTGARPAADAIAVLAAALVVVLAGLLARELTGSRSAGLLAAVAALVSPALAYWSGFTGPDSLAEALALATGLLAVRGRAGTAGVLGGLCIAARPEWSVVLVPLAIRACLGPTTREGAGRSLLAGAFTLAAIVGLFRPPLGAPAGGPLLFLAALGGSTVLQLGVARLGDVSPRRARTAVALSLLAGLTVLVLSGRGVALESLTRDSWPLLALAAAGLLLACGTPLGQPALALLGTVLALGATYAYKNPGSERYLAELVPLLCVLAGFAATIGPRLALPVRHRPIAGAAAGILGVALLGLLAPGRPPVASDAFASLAPVLAHAPHGVLVSAAPDAYGFLLPGRRQRMLRPGARGLILLDGAQRAYAPGLGARGTVIARLAAPNGFERPNGTLDTGPATLIRGVVTRTAG